MTGHPSHRELRLGLSLLRRGQTVAVLTPVVVLVALHLERGDVGPGPHTRGAAGVYSRP